MSVRVDSLRKSFGTVPVLNAVSETFAEAGISVLLGSSGCGKTTTLRCIAGLERPTAGTVQIAGRTVSSSADGTWVPVEKRGVSMVFQSYAIWPHMTVAQNVSVPLKAAGVRRAEIAARVRTALETVGLAHLADRSATRLSGGQQQRVALARCVVSDAPVILMDEPLSNLDAQLRVAMRGEIRRLQQMLKRTILFVTHDQEEALSLADTVYLFRNGAVVQKGPPRDIYDRPSTRYVAEFLGKANILLPGCDPAALSQLVASAEPAIRAAAGGALCIRPEKVALVEPGTAGALAGRITSAMFLGERSEYQMDTPLGTLTVVETSAVSHASGDLVGLRVAPGDLGRIADDA